MHILFYYFKRENRIVELRWFGGSHEVWDTGKEMVSGVFMGSRACLRVVGTGSEDGASQIRRQVRTACD